MTHSSEARPALIRQGDVLLVPVDPDVVAETGGPPGERAEIPRMDGRLVLAEGETTGHAHAIRGTTARLERQSYGGRLPVWMDRRGWSHSRTVLLVDAEVVLEHEEHERLTVAPGAYELRRQREYAPLARPADTRWAGEWPRAGERTVSD